MASNRVDTVFTGTDKMSGVVSKMKTNLASLGKTPMGALGAGLGAVGVGALGAQAGIQMLTDMSGKVSAFLGDSIGLANDFNETVNKGEVIFGENADEVEAWAGTMADKFGQSKGDAIDLASTFAGLFSTVGLTLDDATTKSMKLTELGGDLASFFNTDVTTALEAVRSGLAGESEPLRKFNVFLSEAAVAAKAAELGIGKLGQKLTEGEKVQARYAIIMDQTAVAQGDFANTADSAANAARRFDAALEDTQVTIGQKFTPMMTDMSNVIVDDVMPAFQDLVGLLTSTSDTSNMFLRPALEALAQLPGAAGDAAREALVAFEAAEWSEAAAAAADDMGQNFLSHGRKWGPEIGEAMVMNIREGSKTAMAGLAQQFRYDTDQAMNGIADTIRGNKDTVKSAMEDFVFVLKHPMARLKEMARIEGELTSQRLVDGLNSNDDGIRNAAQDYQVILQNQYKGLSGHAYGVGREIAAALERGLRTFDVPKGLIGSNLFGYGGIRVGGSGKKKRAAGGPVDAGGTYLVGERGPEMLHMGRRGGNITPNAGGGHGHDIYLDGQRVGQAIDQRQGRMLALAPSSNYSR